MHPLAGTSLMILDDSELFPAKTAELYKAYFWQRMHVGVPSPALPRASIPDILLEELDANPTYVTLARLASGILALPCGIMQDANLAPIVQDLVRVAERKGPLDPTTKALASLPYQTRDLVDPTLTDLFWDACYQPLHNLGFGLEKPPRPKELVYPVDALLYQIKLEPGISYYDLTQIASAVHALPAYAGRRTALGEPAREMAVFAEALGIEQVNRECRAYRAMQAKRESV